MSMFPAQLQAFTLNGAGQIIGDTSIILTSMKDIDGNLVSMTSFGVVGYATIEPNSGTSEEQISFSGITQNANGTATLTGVKSVGFLTPFTETSGLSKTHSGGVKLVISNTSGFYNKFANTLNVESISGIWTFATSATPLITDQPTTNLMAANKLYVDTVAISGAPNASDVTKGITLLSVAPVSPTSPIALGVNDSRVPTANQVLAAAGNNTDVAVGSGNKFVTQTGLIHGAETYALDGSVSANTITVTLAPVPTSYTNGMALKIKVANAVTAATTINVNSLGSKSVKKYASTGKVDLQANDILANELCLFQYDGTDFVLASRLPGDAGLYTSGTATYTLTNASGNQTIAHGLGRIPQRIRINAVAQSYSGAGVPNAPGQSMGTYNGTTMNIIYWYPTSGVAATSNIVFINTGGGTQSATVTMDATNITLAWTKSGTPTNGGFGFDIIMLWEAFA